MCHRRYRQVVALSDISELPVLTIREKRNSSTGTSLFNRLRRPSKRRRMTRFFIIHNNGLQYGIGMTPIYSGYLPINPGANISRKVQIGYPHSGGPYPNSPLRCAREPLFSSIIAPGTFWQALRHCRTPLPIKAQAAGLLLYR